MDAQDHFAIINDTFFVDVHQMPDEMIVTVGWVDDPEKRILLCDHEIASLHDVLGQIVRGEVEFDPTP